MEVVYLAGDCRSHRKRSEGGEGKTAKPIWSVRSRGQQRPLGSLSPETSRRLKTVPQSHLTSWGRELRYLSSIPSWGSSGWACCLGHCFSSMPGLPQTRASMFPLQVSMRRVAKVPRATTGHARALIFCQSLIRFLIRHVSDASSVPGTEFATGDSELNKIQSLPRRGSQVNGVGESKTHNYTATQ